jgi:hypothetical protein
LATSNGAASIRADYAVVAANNEVSTGGKNVLKCISAVSAKLQHATVKAEVRVHVRRFKVEVLPERQLRGEPLEKTNVWRVEPFVGNYGWIVDERGIGRRIRRWNRHSGI